MKRFKKIVRKLFADEEGAALVEYGLLVALIALACIAALTTLGPQISALFTAVSDALVPPAAGG